MESLTCSELKRKLVITPDPMYEDEKMVETKPSKFDRTAAEIVSSGEYQMAPSEVMKMYFSKENIDRIQKQIRSEVYDRTEGKFRLIEDQDSNDLNIAMRAVCKLYARNLPFKIIKQVKYLNKQTIEYIVPDIITNVKQYYGHIQEINNPIKPIDLPVNVNNAGRLTLPSVAQIWGL